MPNHMNRSGRIALVTHLAEDLEALQALFRTCGPTWELVSFSREKDFLEKVEAEEFDAIFADLKSEPTAAVNFLHEVWKSNPTIVRHLISSNSDPDVMVACALGAHHVLEKPLEPEALESALHRIEVIKRFVKNPNLQALVSRMRTLPSRPTLYLEIMRELRSSTASAKAVGELVSKDLAISTKLLQVVNSAYYGREQKVADPADAVLVLGLETTASLVLSMEAFARFDKVKPLYFSVEKVWKHSQNVANTARQIATDARSDSAIIKDAYAAGLLHDIGKLALALNFEEQYHGAMKLAKKSGLSSREVEQDVFGANHADTGAYLLSMWGLPLPIIEAVAGHHLPDNEVGTHFSALAAVHLAEKLEFQAEAERSGAEVKVEFNYPAALHLGGIIAQHSGSESDPSTEAEGTMFFTRKSAESAVEQIKPEDFPTPAELHSRATSTALVNYLFGRGKSTAVAIAVVILVLAAIPILLLSNKAKAKAVNTPSVATTKITGSNPQKTAIVSAPAEAHEDFTAGLKLQAILFNNSKSSLVINGRTYKLGDEINGARIVDVSSAEVTLEKGEQLQKLHLK